MRRRTASGLLVPVVLLAVACGSGPPSRDHVISDLNPSIIAGYEQFASDAASLNAAAVSLCGAPEPANLVVAQESLVAARDSWKSSEAVWFGPVMERRSPAVVDWPVNTAQIEELIADIGREMNTETLGSRIGADQRGLGAVEYLLAFSSADTVLAELANARRCDYLVGIAEVIAQEADLVLADWTVSFEDGAPFSEVISQDADMTIDDLVNSSVFLLNALADAELGRALGQRGEPNLEMIVEGPGEFGVTDINARLTGLRSLLLGNELTDGLAPLLSTELVDRLEEQFTAAFVEVAAVQAPLLGSLRDTPENVKQLHGALKTLQVTVATEVVSHLGVTVGFSDADGDRAG